MSFPLKITRVRISNWKSFSFSADPPWIPDSEEFKGINVLIGPNSSGKSNFANALRLVLCEHGTDYGGFSSTIRPCDYSQKDRPINISVEVEMDSHKREPFSQIINPLQNCPEISWPTVHNQIRGRFFPIGPKRLLQNIGEKVATSLRIDGMKNWQLIGENWSTIREHANEFFDIHDFPEDFSRNCQRYMSDVSDSNGAPLLETGSGKVELFYFMAEILKQVKTCRIYLFEEPETHMHPRMQRQFLQYLVHLVKKYEMQFFLTTHSPVFIDKTVLTPKIGAIFSVTKKNETTSFIPIQNNAQALRQLCTDEPGYKASDIIQPNGIIWVEGPSDRIYIKEWLNLWSTKHNQTQFEEGTDFLIVPYGGNLEPYAFFATKNRTDNLVKAIELNPNVFIIIDRDTGGCKEWDKKKWKNKQRLVQQLGENRTWITHEKAVFKDRKKGIRSTIEGYLPKNLKSKFKGKNKRGFAIKAIASLTSGVFKQVGRDLEKKVGLLYESISKWNRI